MARIAMNNFDYTTKIASFTVQSSSDLKYLPRCGIAGQDILNTVQSVNFGSRAFVIDSNKNYILNFENKWQEIVTSSGGGSSGTGGSGDTGDPTDYVEITAEEVADMFKDDISLTFDTSVITVEAKGAELTDSDKVKEGWILTISAPATNPTDNSVALTSITVNGTAVALLTDNEDNTRKTASYTAVTADEKNGITIAAVYGG